MSNHYIKNLRVDLSKPIGRKISRDINEFLDLVGQSSIYKIIVVVNKRNNNRVPKIVRLCMVKR